MRVIIRFSVDGQGLLRNELAGHLETTLWERTGTAIWEKNVSESVLLEELTEFWSRVAHSGQKLDHFWMYADQKKWDESSATAQSPASSA